MKKFIKWFIFITYPFFVLTTLFLLYCFIEEGHRRTSLRETQRQGLEIVEALCAYNLEQSSYPESLNMLVSEYIEEIPSAPWGTSDWIYTGYTDGFFLEVGYDFGESLYPVMSYSPEHGWHMND